MIIACNDYLTPFKVTTHYSSGYFGYRKIFWSSCSYWCDCSDDHCDSRIIEIKIHKNIKNL